MWLGSSTASFRGSVGTPGGFLLDEVELVAGAVDNDDPVAQMSRIAGIGLGEGLFDDSGGIVQDGAAQPFRPLAFGPGRSVRRLLLSPAARTA